jgi:HSP20 family protein
MNLIQRHQPARSWVSEFDRILDRSLFNPASQIGPREAFFESDTAWILRLDLPGFAKPDVKITVTGGNLQLTAETADDRPFGGKMEREWLLGEDVDTNAISAHLENGVLELTLPKKPEVIAAPKVIQVQ